MRKWFVVATLFAAGLSACGGKDAPFTGQPTDGTAELTIAVTNYVAAFAQGNADAAWSMVSSRCQKSVQQPQYRAAVVSSRELYPSMRAAEIRVEVDGDQGRASYNTGVAKVGPYDQQPWRLESGAWRWDAC